jgi:hypothetical protein
METVKEVVTNTFTMAIGNQAQVQKERHQ